jgi:tetratricopeptide (TPR) repeat protein
MAAYRADKDVKLKVTHLYTNRSLSHHQLSDNQKAFEDADHVLRYLDDKNVKALNRRATANKALGRVEDSIRDYQQLLKVNPAGEKDINREIGELMKKLVEQNKAKKEAATKEP